MYPPPVILDEVQYAPDLLPYVKEAIDAHRSRRGQYVLTGSQNLALTGQVTESLAGRVAMLQLLPLSFREAVGTPQAPLPWEANVPASARMPLQSSDLWTNLLRGGYPELIAELDRNISMWHASYIQTYLERDVRSLRQVRNLTSFQNFVRLLAARSGQLLNLADLSRDLGVALNTAKTWLSILEATFQVIILRPYFANVGKRLVKTPKVYFTDTGLLCHLTGLRDAQHLASGPMGGVVFETAVLLEIVKTLMHRGERPQVYFWRTSNGSEVDILLETGGKLVPIEVKLSATPRPAMADSIKMFRQDVGSKAGKGYLVHPGDIRLPLAPGVTALPFYEF